MFVEVLINGKETFLPGSMWEERIAALRHHLQMCGVVVTGIRVDGEDIGTEWEALLNHSMAKKVEIEAEDRDRFVRNVIAGARDYAVVLQNSLLSAAARLQAWSSEGAAIFAAAVDGLAWVRDVLRYRGLLSRDDPALREQWDSYAEGYDRVLQRLMEAWQNRDYLMVADLLEYELAPWLAGLRTLLAETSVLWEDRRSAS